MPDTNDWRAVIAALSNEDLRELLARLILGEDVSDDLAGRAPSRRTRLRAGLLKSGMVRDDGGTLVFDGSGLAEILATTASPRATGVDRFVRDGRIERYPSGADDRTELLTWAAGRVLDDGEIVSERELNERLSAHTDDVAGLRRALVDAELVERRRDGSEYALVTPTYR